MPFASSSDVGTALGRPLTTAEAAQATLVISLVEGMITEIAGAAVTSPPSYYKGLCIEKARALIVNPEGAAMRGESLGDYSREMRWGGGGGGATVTVFLTPMEERIVRRIANNRVSVATPTQGLPHQVLVREP